MNRFTPCYSVSIVNFELLNVYMKMPWWRCSKHWLHKDLKDLILFFQSVDRGSWDKRWGPRKTKKLFFFFFLSGFSFTDADSSQDSRGREGTFVYSTLLLLPAHDYSDFYLQLCMWDGNHVFLITTLVY